MGSWYDWAEAASSIATAGTLIVSLFIVRRQILADRNDQATKIAAWTHKVAQGPEWVELAVRVRNASSLPAYLVIIQVEVGVRGTYFRHLDTLAPAETREVVVFLPGFPRSHLVEPALGFTDSRGQTWKRIHGQLSKASIQDIRNLQQRHPGGYNSEAEHPTLWLPKDHLEHRGRSV